MIGLITLLTRVLLVIKTIWVALRSFLVKFFRFSKSSLKNIDFKKIFSIGFLLGISSIIGPIVLQILIYLGLTSTVIYGLTLVYNQVFNFIINQFLGIPIEIQQLLGLAKIDVAINIIFGAYIVRFSLIGLKNSQTVLKKKFV